MLETAIGERTHEPEHDFEGGEGVGRQLSAREVKAAAKLVIAIPARIRDMTPPSRPARICMIRTAAPAPAMPPSGSAKGNKAARPE